MLDPDAGTRVHRQFVRVQNGKPVALDNSPYRWRTDSGRRPTDEWLAAQQPAFYGLVETDPPTYDPTTEKVVKVRVGLLPLDEVTKTVTQQWSVVALTPGEIANTEARNRQAVTAERDRRLNAGFDWSGVHFDGRPEDKTRIAGAAQLAFMYLVDGGDPLATDWNNPGSGQPFSWIASDNTVVTMTAPQVIDFAKAAARWESLNVFAARALKDTPGGVPVDYNLDIYWPDPATFNV